MSDAEDWRVAIGDQAEALGLPRTSSVGDLMRAYAETETRPLRQALEKVVEDALRALDGLHHPKGCGGASERASDE